MSRRVLGALLALTFMSAVQADVYKWVDENGKVHYSDQPPPTTSTDKLDKVKTDTLDEYSKAAAASRLERLRAGGGNSEPEAQSSSSQGTKPDSDLDCAEAVSNAKDWLDSMKEVGRRNVMTGHLKESDYREALTSIEDLRGNLSVSDCNSSKGHVREFYQCTSNINNHVLHCAERHLKKRR